MSLWPQVAAQATQTGMAPGTYDYRTPTQFQVAAQILGICTALTAT